MGGGVDSHLLLGIAVNSQHNTLLCRFLIERLLIYEDTYFAKVVWSAQ